MRATLGLDEAARITLVIISARTMRAANMNADLGIFDKIARDSRYPDCSTSIFLTISPSHNFKLIINTTFSIPIYIFPDELNRRPASLASYFSFLFGN